MFGLLARHPRLVEPLRQLFGEDVYVHQFKLNAKAAFEGDVWQWHQDYGTWAARRRHAGAARAMNIAIFLDEVMPINGPLMLIPKSHKQGVFAGRPRHAPRRRYPLWTLDKETVTRLAADAAGPDGVGIVAPTGKAGSVLMFHGNLVHASPPNITPYPRKIVYLTLCAVLQPHHQVHPRRNGSRIATSRRSRRSTTTRWWNTRGRTGSPRNKLQRKCLARAVATAICDNADLASPE